MSGFAGKIIFSGDFQSSNSLLIENGLLCRGKEFKKIVNLTEKCAAFNVLNENQLSSEVNLIENEKYIINFDGRIDNKQRLSNELKIDSYATNAEIVLKGYEVWGNELPNHIIGCFCFCIYDKDHKEILCATDHLSMRSLYYLISEDGFFYASEPKFIFMLSGLRKELNENKLRASILRSEQNNNETFFKRVSKLDRGMLLRASDTKNEIIKYFEFSEPNYLNFNDEREYIELFYETYKTVIQSQMHGLTKIGTALSGGLDSTSVSRMLVHNSNKNGNNSEIYSYSYNFTDLETHEVFKTNEMKFANEAVEMGGLNSRVVNIKRTNHLIKFLDDQKLFPQPCIHGNRYQELELIKACKKDNINTIFTGFDGDCTIGYGLEKIQMLLEDKKIHEALKENRLYRRRMKLKDNTFQLLGLFLFLKNMPICIHYAYKKMKNFNNFESHHSFLNEDIKNQLDYYQMLKQKRKLMFDSKLGHQKLLNSKDFSQILEMLDIDYSYNGIEERHPFCDKRLMNLCLKIPATLKLKDGYTRYILREAMKNHLPNSIYKRMSKADMSPYFFHSANLMMNDLIQNLIETNTQISDYFNKDFLKKVQKDNSILNLEQRTLIVYYNATDTWIKQNSL